MRKFSTRDITMTAVIAALYVAMTYISAALGLSSGAIQFRISEAMYALALVSHCAVPGLTVGCLLANMLTGCLPWDIVFGTLATYIGALGAYKMRRHGKWALLIPVASNALIVPFVIAWVYGVETAIPILIITVGIGEAVCAFGLGALLYPVIKNKMDKR